MAMANNQRLQPLLELAVATNERDLDENDRAGCAQQKKLFASPHAKIVHGKRDRLIQDADIKTEWNTIAPSDI